VYVFGVFMKGASVVCGQWRSLRETTIQPPSSESYGLKNTTMQ
jgi:hypothetical protein